MHTLITGASSGIGEAIARRLGRDPKHRLTLVARRTDKLNEIAAELDATVQVLPFDLSSQSDIPELVQLAIEKLGPIDTLINNAGINCVKDASDVTHQEAARIFSVNVLSPMALTEAVLPSMKERASGTIVNISSVAAINTPTGMAHYSATKAALAKYSESLHLELKKSGIHVLTVYPGPVATAMEAQARESFGTDLGIAGQLPMGTSQELAVKIDDAIRKQNRKLFYPEFYRSTMLFPNLSQCLTERFTPSLLEPQ